MTGIGACIDGVCVAVVAFLTGVNNAVQIANRQLPGRLAGLKGANAHQEYQ